MLNVKKHVYSWFEVITLVGMRTFPLFCLLDWIQIMFLFFFFFQVVSIRDVFWEDGENSYARTQTDYNPTMFQTKAFAQVSQKLNLKANLSRTSLITRSPQPLLILGRRRRRREGARKKERQRDRVKEKEKFPLKRRLIIDELIFKVPL